LIRLTSAANHNTVGDVYTNDTEHVLQDDAYEYDDRGYLVFKNTKLETGLVDISVTSSAPTRNGVATTNDAAAKPKQQILSVDSAIELLETLPGFKTYLALTARDEAAWTNADAEIKANKTAPDGIIPMHILIEAEAALKEVTSKNRDPATNLRTCLVGRLNEIACRVVLREIVDQAVENKSCYFYVAYEDPATNNKLKTKELDFQHDKDTNNAVSLKSRNDSVDVKVFVTPAVNPAVFHKYVDTPKKPTIPPKKPATKKPTIPPKKPATKNPTTPPKKPATKKPTVPTKPATTKKPTKVSAPKGKGSKKGVIIGISIAVVVVLLLAGGIAYYYMKKHRKSGKSVETIE